MNRKMGPVAYFGLCLLGCLAFGPSSEGARNRSLPLPRSPCPPGAYYYNSKCYEYMNDPIWWEEAEAACRYWRDGHLASIASAAEERMVSNYIRRSTTSNRVWIGFRGVCISSKLDWTWSDGSPYAPGSALWDQRRPSIYGSSNQCVALYNVQYPTGSNRWREDSCYCSLPYLCKYSAAFKARDGPSAINGA